MQVFQECDGSGPDSKWSIGGGEAPSWWLKVTALYKQIRYLFLLMPDVAKFAVVLVGKSLVISVIMAFLATPATALFAARFGMRVPLEGTPYLGFTLGLWSFIGFALSMVLVTCCVFVLFQFKLLFHWASNFIESLRLEVYMGLAIDPISVAITVSDEAAKIVSVVFDALVRTVLPYAAVAIFVSGVSYYLVGASGFFPILDHESFYTALLLAAAASLIAFSVWYAGTNRKLWLLQGYLTIPLAVVMSISLFAYDTYGSVLRVIRFGGGIEAAVQLEGLQYNGSDSLRGNLLMRSSTSLFMLTEDDLIVEVPTKNVSLVTAKYDADWRMPPSSVTEQRRYISVE